MTRRIPTGESRTAFELSTVGRVLLAVLSGTAGAIHLAMVPSHWSESVVEGGGFAVVGWFQIGLALWLLAHPSRNALRVAVLTNIGFVAVWMVSRAWGLPVGAHAGHPHDAGFVDLACVGIEVALVVVAGFVLLHPDVGRDWRGARLAVAAVIPISVLALATAALASPSARDHAHSSHDGHTHDGTLTAADAGDAHHHSAAAVPADDLGLSKLENGHQHGTGDVKLDHATQAALTAQLAQTMPLIEKYPTIATAEAAGFRRAGRFNPGLGTHYTGGRGDGIIVGVNGERMVPQLIYDGTDPDSPLAGFMYMANGPNGAPPEGFIGPNDHWHEHENLCIKFDAGKIIALASDDAKMTPDKCSQLGGMYIQQSGFMIHVWTVPGYESSLGVFSGVNPKLKCPDGTYFKAPEGGGTADSTCKNPN